ncbi:hypothetical protein TURU_088870 [Turdus rufiventris]|nr:hypothetical protein TURU_088870 [Turdus rufiventris]
MSMEKLKALEELVAEQLAKGHIEETTNSWNSPVSVIKKPGKDKWRLLHDLPEITADMGSLQPGMPYPTILPQNWKLAVLDIKDCFFQIPLHPEDAPWFAFSVPTINREAPMKRYHRKDVNFPHLFLTLEKIPVLGDLPLLPPRHHEEIQHRAPRE